MSLGERVSELRAEYNLNKRQLAEQIGITPTYLSNIENNESDPSSSILAKISIFLGRDMAYFIYGTSKIYLKKT